MKRRSCYLPLHMIIPSPSQLARDAVLQQLNRFGNPTIKDSDNIKFDQEVLANHNIQLKGCCMIQCCKLHLIVVFLITLGFTALRHLGVKPLPMKMLQDGAKQLPFIMCQLMLRRIMLQKMPILPCVDQTFFKIRKRTGFKACL